MPSAASSSIASRCCWSPVDPDALREQEASAQRTLLTLQGNEDLRSWLAAVAAARLGDKRAQLQ